MILIYSRHMRYILLNLELVGLMTCLYPNYPPYVRTFIAQFQNERLRVFVFLTPEPLDTVIRTVIVLEAKLHHDNRGAIQGCFSGIEYRPSFCVWGMVLRCRPECRSKLSCFDYRLSSHSGLSSYRESLSSIYVGGVSFRDLSIQEPMLSRPPRKPIG